MPIFVIPFSIFFACCVAQFFFLERVKRALSARHAGVLRGLLGSSFFAGNAIFRFAWQRGDRGLNDADLTKRVEQLRLLLFVAFGAWGLCALAIITGTASQPLSLDWSPGGNPGPVDHIQPRRDGRAPDLRGANLIPSFEVAFAAAFLCNLVYLALAWRLSARWNSIGLGTTATLGDPLAVLGVIWWSRPAARDEAFLRLRLAARAAFVLASAGTIAVFGLVLVMLP